MRPLGKTMKIGYQQGQCQAESLQKMLDSYRYTPRPATGLQPASMLFRDDHRRVFPRKNVAEAEVISKGKRCTNQRDSPGSDK